MTVSVPIRLITFDALYTLIVPRRPIHVQYAEVFEPYLGAMNPESIQKSFKAAFKSMEQDATLPAKGSERWWGEVIKKTALGAGANSSTLEQALPTIVPRLLTRFSSKEGYQAFDDSLHAVQSCKDMGIMAAVITNADARIRSALQDLDFPSYLDPIVLSEEEGAEKPSSDIFLRTLSQVNAKLVSQEGISPLKPEECLHVGDELDCDYRGALRAEMQALLLVRRGQERAHRDSEAQATDGVHVVRDLQQVVEWARNHNALAGL